MSRTFEEEKSPLMWENHKVRDGVGEDTCDIPRGFSPSSPLNHFPPPHNSAPFCTFKPSSLKCPADVILTLIPIPPTNCVTSYRSTFSVSDKVSKFTGQVSSSDCVCASVCVCQNA